MNKRKRTVLAIYPNSTGFGYAVMEDALTPLEAEVVRINPICNTKALKRIKEKIDFFEPSIIVLEDPEGKFSVKSLRVKKLIRSVLQHAKQKEA